MLDRLLLGPACSARAMIGDPDPYTAALSAMELFRVDDVVIFDAARRGARAGLRANLLERLRGANLGARRACRRRAQTQARPRPRPPRGARWRQAGIRARSRARPRGAHGPPPRESQLAGRASASSGLLLFIISEVDWSSVRSSPLISLSGSRRATLGRRHGTTLPVEVAGVNIRDPGLVLVHDALRSADWRSRTAIASA